VLNFITESRRATLVVKLVKGVASVENSVKPLISVQWIDVYMEPQFPRTVNPVSLKTFGMTLRVAVA
jgi:hypothetical protein